MFIVSPHLPPHSASILAIFPRGLLQCSPPPPHTLNLVANENLVFFSPCQPLTFPCFHRASKNFPDFPPILPKSAHFEDSCTVTLQKGISEACAMVFALLHIPATRCGLDASSHVYPHGNTTKLSVVLRTRNTVANMKERLMGMYVRFVPRNKKCCLHRDKVYQTYTVPLELKTECKCSPLLSRPLYDLFEHINVRTCCTSRASRMTCRMPGNMLDNIFYCTSKTSLLDKSTIPNVFSTLKKPKTQPKRWG